MYLSIVQYLRISIWPGCKQIVREGGTERALVSEARDGHEIFLLQLLSGRQGRLKPGVLKLGVCTRVLARGVRTYMQCIGTTCLRSDSLLKYCIATHLYVCKYLHAYSRWFALLSPSGLNSRHCHCQTIASKRC
jgi:hypothetical protein